VSRKKPPRASAARNRQPACVELDARPSIAQAADLHRTLLARLAKGGPVVIDGARVEEIDTAMLQLLVSLWRTGGERGIDCTWKGASGALRQTAALVGVAEVLNFPAGETV
jgi:anti-anti-sigma regulatory factor